MVGLIDLYHTVVLSLYQSVFTHFVVISSCNGACDWLREVSVFVVSVVVRLWLWSVTWCPDVGDSLCRQVLLPVDPYSWALQYREFSRTKVPSSQYTSIFWSF